MKSDLYGSDAQFGSFDGSPATQKEVVTSLGEERDDTNLPSPADRNALNKYSSFKRSSDSADDVSSCKK